MNCKFFTGEDALLCTVNPMHCDADAGITPACKEFEHNGYPEVLIDLSDRPDYWDYTDDPLLAKHIEYYQTITVPQLIKERMEHYRNVIVPQFLKEQSANTHLANS